MKTFRHFKGFWTVIRGYSKMSANEKVPHTKIKEAWSKTGRSSRSVAVPQTLPRIENRSELPALKHFGCTVATVGFPDIGLQGFAPKLARGEIASLSGVQDDARYFCAGMGRPALRAEASINMKNAWPSVETPGRSKCGAPATPWTNPN